MSRQTRSSMRRLLRSTPIPVLAAVAGLLLGVSVWLIIDRVQSHAIREIFHQELVERLQQREHESLVRFDHFIESYKTTTRLLANHRRMAAYLDPIEWQRGIQPEPVIYDYDPPIWLPDQATWELTVPPSHVLLLDTDSHIREQYSVGDAPLPVEALARGTLNFQLKETNAYLTKLGRQPYLLVFEMIEDSGMNIMGSLVLLIPVDSEFLLAAQQRVNPNDAVYALLDGENQRVLSSSDKKRIPVNILSDDMVGDYELTMHSFAEYGDSDLNLFFTTFVPRSQVAATGKRILQTERLQRLGSSAILVIAFVSFFILMSSYINRLLKRLSKLSSHALGIDRRHVGWGNQLLILEDWIKEFIKQVMRARDEMRVQHESQMRQSEALTTAIMDASLDSIVTIDHDGGIVDFNPTAERTFGYQRRDVLGRQLDELLLTTQSRHALQKLMGDCEQAVAEAPVNAQMQAVTSDGQVFPVELAIKAIILGQRRLLTVYIRDYSERQRQQDEIASLAAFPSESPSPVLRVNRPGVVIYANGPSQPLLDYWGCELLQTLPVYWRKQIQEVLAKRSTCELEVQIDDKLYSLLLAPIADLGYVNIYAHDITQMRKAEAEARRRQNELVHVSRLSTMGEMATGIAHELNQPLSAIVNYANGCARRLSVKDSGSEELLNALCQISGQAKRAGEIIKRLRGMVTRQQPVREEHDLNELISEVCSLLAHDTQKNGLDVDCRLNPEPLIVRVDPVQIEQAILNLMRNSMDALQDIPPSQRKLIVVSGMQEAGKAIVCVRDSGAGIHPKEMGSLFDAFYTTKQTGMGMGLAITQTIVEQHDGKIRAETWLGKGTSFTIELPLANEALRSIAS